MNEQWIEQNGKSLYVKSEGKGDPILFLHGGPGGSLDYFLPEMEPLTNSMHVIFYDQKGCGKSPADPSGRYSIRDEVRDLEALRVAMDLEKITLFGESWGSILALSYAVAYPEHVSGLILTAAIGLSSEDHLAFKNALLQKLGFRQKLKFGWYSILSGITDSSRQLERLLDPFYVHSQESLVRKKDISYNREAQKQISRDIESTYDLLPVIDRIQGLPILIAQGSHDILTPAYMEAQILPHLPNADLVEVRDSGHWTVLEKPVEMRGLVEMFMNRSAHFQIFKQGGVGS
ncbi:alpha/beta hydrolase [Rossellomorea marisflavi]|uniref:alpha/beta fold hydrolase n=1 Tax=Rossellomorea marisflavi TaxID=189381 RepID=UPI0027A1BFE1|nr:alpha/beta hydrolase [Rossellomorea marisflavi]UTE72070.1 alpha/beta hydrolase [Rossellomorea marisflavi]